MRLVSFAAVWLIGGMILIPSLAIVPWQLTLPADWGGWFNPYSRLGLIETVQRNFADTDAFVQAVVRVATALVAAGFFARVLARSFCPRADLKADPLSGQTRRLLDLVTMISVVALIVGWQSTSGVLLVSSVFAWLTKGFWKSGTSGDSERTDALGRFSIMLPVALALQVLLWRPLMQWGYWPSAPSIIEGTGNGDMDASRGVLLGFALATLFIPLWLKEPSPADQKETNDHEFEEGESNAERDSTNDQDSARQKLSS
jgi:leader peptidase (prepilin peptidase)/N-methyltransferase